MRVKHYVKNLLIFVPLIFSKKLFGFPLLINLICGFISFSLLASVVYIINDIRDAEKDRAHPTKCKRPIASGKIKKKPAVISAIVIFITSLAVHFIGSGNNYISLCILLGYFVINLGYSFGLKKIPLLDVAILASGFLLRMFYGSVISRIDLSEWLYLTTVLASFYLGFGKRRNEFKTEASVKRDVLNLYTYAFLDKSMNMCMTLAMVFYSLWTIEMSQSLSSALIWTVPFLLMIVLKYNYNIEKDSDGDPTEIIFRDPVLITMIVLYMIAMFMILYI